MQSSLYVDRYFDTFIMNHFNSNTMHASIPGEERIAALAAHVLTAAEVVTVNLRLGPRTE